jgi:hypothetical protein
MTMIKEVEVAYMTDTGSQFGLLGGRRVDARIDVSEYKDSNTNNTIESLGLNSMPDAIQNFAALIWGVLAAIKFIIKFLFNLTIGFGDTVAFFFPTLFLRVPSLKLAISGFVFLNNMLYIFYKVVGR